MAWPTGVWNELKDTRWVIAKRVTHGICGGNTISFLRIAVSNQVPYHGANCLCSNGTIQQFHVLYPDLLGAWFD